MFLEEKCEGEQQTNSNPLQQSLIKAADFLEKNLWCQGQGTKEFANGQTAYCLLGALYHSSNPNKPEFVTQYSAMKTVISNLLSKKEKNWRGQLHHWNDVTGRTKEEVVQLIREAAKTL